MAAVLELPRKRRSLSPGPVDLEDHITQDLFCVECGGNLRGQNVRLKCQSCGHSNSDSVFGDFLIYSGPLEIRRFEESSTVVIHVAAFTGALGLIVIVGLLMGSKGLLDAIDRAFDGLLFTAMLTPVVTIFGQALLTWRHSVAYLQARYGNPKSLVTLGIICVLIVVACVMFASFAPEYFAAAACAVWAIGPTVLFLNGMRGLMRRVPNNKLANFASWMTFPLIALALIGLFVHVARPAIQSPSDWDGPLLAMKVIVVLGGIGWSVGVYRLLVLARGSIRIAGR